MKKTILVSGSALVMFQLISCEKNSSTTCKQVQAKIIRYDCDRVIFQLLNTELSGDANWVDVTSGQRYRNVVSYYNTCKITSLTNGRYDTLYVDLKKTGENPISPGCFQCLAISADPPQTKVDFTSISKERCGELNSKDSK